MAQKHKVIEYIAKHGSITQREAIKFGCYRLSGRIFDLKAIGLDIETELKTVRNSDGSHATIAVYKFGEESRRLFTPQLIDFLNDLHEFNKRRNRDKQIHKTKEVI